jgi:predicted outer membrane repeat protein
MRKSWQIPGFSCQLRKCWVSRAGFAAFALGSTLTVSGCTISNSYGWTGGGILNDGTLTVSNSTLSGNKAISGGGLYNNGSRLMTLNACTLAGNSAREGGAIFNEVHATLTNCTLANNKASTYGGALYVSSDGLITMAYCTVSLNSATYGGGIYISFSRPGLMSLGLFDTIVAGNTASISDPDIDGAVATADHNLVGDATGSSGIVNGVNGNIVGGNGNPVINALLGPLQNNGGPTETMALLAGSPALGHADNSKAPAADQRGITRGDEAGEATDIGAFEL